MNQGRHRWAAIGLIVLVGSGLAANGAATVQGVSATAEAFGVFANTLTGDVAKSPYATVPTGGWMGEDEATSVALTGVVSAQNLVTIATGAGDTHDVSAEASSTAEQINVLSGLITAEGVVAIASSAVHGTTANSNAEGSNFVGLVVNGVSLSATPAPNTRVTLPGVGYVVLNEQIPSGDGVNSSGITLNMIHVVLQETVTDLLGQTTTVTTGEIIVGSAQSHVAR